MKKLSTPFVPLMITGIAKSVSVAEQAPAFIYAFVKRIHDLKVRVVTYRWLSQKWPGANIEEGGKVIVDRSCEAKHGDIVVAVVEGEYTLKRLFEHRGKLELRAENPAYSALVFGDGGELVIWGVVVGVVRRYGVKSPP